jgi:hypothetical protein
MTSTDEQIRSALRRIKLRHLYESPTTLVVEELGLAHAAVRVDLAVINGSIHGFEIKSGNDTLYRLPRQLQLYSQYLEKLTLVCAEKHVESVLQLVPRWCGVIAAREGPRGGISFASLQRAIRNPSVRPQNIAHLLWREEAVQLLRQREIAPSVLRKSRKELYEVIGTLLTVPELTAAIRSFMLIRRDWRDLRLRA